MVGFSMVTIGERLSTVSIEVFHNTESFEVVELYSVGSLEMSGYWW